MDKVFSAIRMTLRGEVATLQAVKDEPVEQGGVITVQVDKLRFTQSGCSERFFGGRPLEATIGAILGGAVDPLSAEWLVLRVVKRNGMLLSMDNRRLYCLKEAQRRTRLRDAARDVWVRAQVYTWDPVLDTFLQHLDHDCWGGAGATIPAASPPPPPPRAPPPQGPPATGLSTLPEAQTTKEQAADCFDCLSDSAAPGYWPNATTDTATGTPTSTGVWGPAFYMRPNTAARQAGASASQTPRPQGTNDDGETILGPWRACCRCGEPIGDPPDHEFSAFRGIRAEDANICSLGVASDRCRHCGLPHDDRAVAAGLKECHAFPCTGHGWVATRRASRYIPECVRIPRIIETLDF